MHLNWNELENKVNPEQILYSNKAEEWHKTVTWRVKLALHRGRLRFINVKKR